ncbi:aminopeptidase N [Falsirhodobacter sp. 20TX0035]|uniref:aminopeptidase N n=1 Tax=Falsirhodobacter sp. 20TX0035 TaxID=3022019 RepID=UPI00232C31B4|nr:aminopeptidase N [Falsirhodobacter sp. 20TX0035]MDB6453490.1 aminopeptidase N [Falsirhodobacter sp. 20TX0035]
MTVRLADYTPFSHPLDRVALTFRLSPDATRVLAVFQFGKGGTSLRLDGEQLRLIACSIDDVPVDAVPDATGLTLTVPDRPFVLETEVEIAPAANTALEGLYMSNGMYCTQCEAEGFRKITFYPDRPDVMARFHVRVEGDLPVLLSNGNLVAQGDGWAEWDDPWPKPAYLFALVAGDLVAHSDRFTTMTGDDVALNIWVRPGDEGRCAYAMDSLIRSMRWDEEVYRRPYDLSVFNIVAVDDFNMGAMENKGLNIFNSKYVLALPETATDDDFARIEAIIAHEYFHNWTGNRITCRDWFQLCLKEGLTVFRDQQFSADMRSAPVKRIEDVLTLRARQFREDAGPLAHPVRPAAYEEINNFYTATVYEKGAEVIGMLKRLVGDEGYAKALNLYFDRHDGQACTIEDWLTVFQDATGRDLSQFKRWYTEAGTPHVVAEEAWDGHTFTLTFRQTGAGGPKVIPLATGLLGQDGTEVRATEVLQLTQPEQSFRFEGLTERPVASILRGFSAPVVLEKATSAEERAFLLAHDTDPFNRWEAGRALAKDGLTRMATEGGAPPALWLDALGALAADESLDPAFRALALRLPGEEDIAQTLARSGVTPDPEAIHAARRRMTRALAERLESDLPALTAPVPGPWSPDAGQAGRRSLRMQALGLLSHLDGGQAAQGVFDTATNMTEEVGALSALLDVGAGAEALEAFHARWQDDRIVMDKWFTLQVLYAADAPAVADRLTRHPLFDLKNPNRFRALFGALSANHRGFHKADGSGYRLLADWLIRLDPLNPQTAARMSQAFDGLSRYDVDRQALMHAELARILSAPGLSRDLAEMAGRMAG